MERKDIRGVAWLVMLPAPRRRDYSCRSDGSTLGHFLTFAFARDSRLAAPIVVNWNKAISPLLKGPGV